MIKLNSEKQNIVNSNRVDGITRKATESYGIDCSVVGNNVYLTVDLDRVSKGTEKISVQQIITLGRLRNLYGEYDDDFDYCRFFIRTLIYLCQNNPDYNFYVYSKRYEENNTEVYQPEVQQVYQQVPVQQQVIFDKSKHTPVPQSVLHPTQQDMEYLHSVSKWAQLAVQERTPRKTSDRYERSEYEVVKEDVENRVKTYKWIKTDKLDEWVNGDRSWIYRNELRKFYRDGLIEFEKGTHPDVIDDLFFSAFLNNADASQMYYDIKDMGYKLIIRGFN